MRWYRIDKGSGAVTPCKESQAFDVAENFYLDPAVVLGCGRLASPHAIYSIEAMLTAAERATLASADGAPSR